MLKPDPDFFWAMNAAGYCWERQESGNKEPENVIVPAARGTYATYAPTITEPNMYLRIANVHQTAPELRSAAVLQFYNDFGDLFERDAVSQYCKTTSLWTLQTRNLTSAVALFEAISNRRARALSAIASNYDLTPLIVAKADQIPGPDHPFLVFVRTPNFETAYSALLDLLNYGLLQPDVSSTQTHVPLKLRRNELGLIEVTMNPLTLLGAGWAQLAQAVLDHAKVGRCKYCGDSFQVAGRGGATVRRRFCSDVHRVLWGRKQKTVKTRPRKKR